VRTVYGVTIDPKEAKALDDAVTARRINGTTHVEISIADPTRQVPIGGATDIAALELCFTRFCDGNGNGFVPMLPIEISQGNSSLLPGEERPVITISCSIGDNLEPYDIKIERAILVSHAQLHYPEVDEMLYNPNDCHPLHSMFNTLNVLAHALQRKRSDIGGLTLFDLGDGLALKESRIISWVRLSGNNHPSHVIVQEMMIMANTIIANFLWKHSEFGLFRNHEKNGKDDLGAVMKRAIYSTQPTGHYGLRLPVYTHGTSPLRRYIDLAVMRLLLSIIDGEELPYSPAGLFNIMAYVNQISMSTSYSTEGLQDF